MRLALAALLLIPLPALAGDPLTAAEFIVAQLLSRLVLVLLVGRSVNGSIRWLPLGPFNLQPAEFGKLALFVYLAGYLVRRQSEVRERFIGFMKPMAVLFVVAILLLALRPLAGIVVDPLIALPLGGLVGALMMGKFSKVNQFAVSGLARMAPVAIMLLGTGTLAGIIANSGLKDVLISGLTASGLPSYLLAPISGALMSLATASTTAGTVVASNVFSSTLIELGISSLAGAAMIHAGATVFDHMPHGSFFHATGGSVHMGVGERLKLIPYETAVGLTIAAVSTLMFGVFGLA